MRINKEQVISELSLRHFGSKGWMNSEDVPCPNCGRSDKFGILFTNTGGVTHCFYNCDNNMSLYSYLKHIGRKDLVEYEQEVSIHQKLRSVYKEEEITEEELPEVSLPKGFERIYYDKYLSDRNFRSIQYEQFQVGTTDHFVERRLKNFLIFVLKQKGRTVGWIARSKNSKQWHKDNIERHKLGMEPIVLRYVNSTGTDFERILGGIDEINDNTDTVIAVEGIFDKVNVSNLLSTHKSDNLKVVFTFGDKFSDHQISLLRQTKVKNVILMYDPNTVEQSKRYSMELSKYFNVDVCYIEDPNTDPGNIDLNYLQQILNNKKNFYYFYHSKISLKSKKT